MNIDKIQKEISKIIKEIDNTNFIYKLLLAYNLPKASITRLQKGDLNLSKIYGEIKWKNKLYFRETSNKQLLAEIDLIRKNEKLLSHNPRFIIITNYSKLVSYDTKTNEGLDIELRDLPNHFEFFLPWSGMEKASYQGENPADVKAAIRMATLFDIIKVDNPEITTTNRHDLNVFLIRLLFCLFAEDTNIFETDKFTYSIESYTQPNGSDLKEFFEKLYIVLNKKNNERLNLPEYLKKFPYVNGGLFEKSIQIPNLSTNSRKAIIEAGKLDWSGINPDIFGSMMQAVIRDDIDDDNTKHYTSVPNIMKVINPLFLEDLYNEFENSGGDLNKLRKFSLRLSKIKIFDPACGSGNFLIIAYKELRRLEIKVILEIEKVSGNQASMRQLLSGIHLNSFYGIEINDFACEVAKLSLWLAEHQMNLEFKNNFGRTNPTLPLKEAGNIVQGNACRLDWEDVCPKEREDDEIYVLGNPPYVGARMQNKIQKEDISMVFEGISKMKKIDYIACWFYKSSKYIQNINVQYAFVSTNSISQGEQAGVLWQHLLGDKLEIFFAYPSFRWNNNAKNNAGVTVAIIGIRNKSTKNKYIFINNKRSKVRNINSYLIDAPDIFINRLNSPLSFEYVMEYGNMAIDGGNLILNSEDRNKLLKEHSKSHTIIRKIIGAAEFLNGYDRYCLWIKDSELSLALNVPEISHRINLTKIFREGSSDIGTHKLAIKPHQFREMKEPTNFALFIPTVSSEVREYIPIGIVNRGDIIIAPNQAVYDPEHYLFSVISSRMHMTWVRTVAGRLKTDYRYSSTLCYNTFPFPKITENKKNELTQNVYRILEEREKHPEKTLTQLYDPNKMPDGLREAHRLNDLAIERCYRSKPFVSDEERLEYLFKMYKEMVK